MTGGEFTISTGDDGFHSDGELTISDGTVQIDSSYEGIEGMQITISGGEITVKASDDGLNSAGGSDEMSAAPQDRFWDQANLDCWIRITGGTLQVDAGGDGLDSNGGLYVDGGCVLISGPTSSGDGALDYGSVAEVTGGTVIAAGSAGMASGFGETSSQYSFLIAFATPIPGGTDMTVTDSAGIGKAVYRIRHLALDVVLPRFGRVHRIRGAVPSRWLISKRPFIGGIFICIFRFQGQHKFIKLGVLHNRTSLCIVF